MPGLDEFQVLVRRENEADPYSMDELVVRVACNPSLAQQVAACALEVTRVRATVEVVEAKAIYDPGRQAKAKRFVDTRKA
jgi:phenylacetate-coenzyme A ligase PaaK-like adenylate-forming protein